MTNRELERLLRAAANRRRLDILRLLSRRRATSVVDLAVDLKLSFRSTSKHLQLLRHEGFVESEQVGRAMEYKLAADLSVGHRQILNLVRI